MAVRSKENDETPRVGIFMIRTIPRRLSLWAPVALYMLFIFGLSAASSPPELPGAVSDKFAHAILYAGLAALLVRARADGWRQPVTLAVAVTATLLATLYGASDELHQYFVPLRQVEVRDVLADAVGAGLASVAFYAWSRFSNRPPRGAFAGEEPRSRGV